MLAHPNRFLIACLLAYAVALPCGADIAYHVKVQPDDGRLAVTITAPVRAKETRFQIPVWSPGAYIIGNYARNVSDVAATDEKGAALVVEHPDEITWAVATAGAKQVRLSYLVTMRGGEEYQLSGPRTYMYVVDRKTEPCTVSFDVPEGWDLALGLDPAGERTYRAKGYDVLADAPVQMGKFQRDEFTVRGVPHTVITYGAGAGEIDRKRLVAVCRQIAETQTAFFGDIPYGRYAFLFDVFKGADGAGGLEHLSSTSIGLASGLGPSAVYVISHEFFHLWNVKRIRPRVLGPFDYTQAAPTRNLWFSEGVTDYYASLLLHRGGMLSREDYLKGLRANIQSLQSNPARLQVSGDDSSLRVWEARNSSGYGGLSYYLKGELIGLCLDLKIRDLTDGKRSLDDVMRALYEQCGRGDGPGFEEDGIRSACIKLAGPEIGPFYDRLARSTEEMPFAEVLAPFGVRCLITYEQTAGLSGALRPDTTGGGLAVRMSRGGALEGAGLRRGDVVVAVDGRAAGSTEEELAKTAEWLRTGLKAGQTYKLTVVRGEERIELDVTAQASTTATVDCRFDPDPLPRQKRLQEGWLSGKAEATRAARAG